MTTYEFRAPADPNKYPNLPESEHREPIGDRFGEFVPEIGAHKDAADAQPTHAERLARQGKGEPPAGTKPEQGSDEETESAKRVLGIE